MLSSRKRVSYKSAAEHFLGKNADCLTNTVKLCKLNLILAEHLHEPVFVEAKVRYAAKPERARLIFISCGSKEGPDRIMQAAEALKAAGFNAKGYVSPGTGHEFQTWRRSLLEMAPMLFKK